MSNPKPKHLSFPAHGSSVLSYSLTAVSYQPLMIIQFTSSAMEELVRSLDGHEGGVLAIAACRLMSLAVIQVCVSAPAIISSRTFN